VEKTGVSGEKHRPADNIKYTNAMYTIT
jgi:hypothetical protein